MKKHTHKLISVLLCAALLLSMAAIVPFASSAAVTENDVVGAAVDSESVGANYQCCSDFIGGGGGLVHFKGWAFNRSDYGETLDIHVYIGGPAGTSGAEGNPFNKANVQRADVHKVYGCGNFHGYDFRVTTNKRGSQPVYVYAVGSGGNIEIAHTTIAIGNPNNPIGSFDGAQGSNGVVHVDGWAFDIDNGAESLDVHIYIGGPAGSSSGEIHGIKANAYRPDVDNVHHQGKNHGFDANITTNKRGTQTVYAYAINIYGGQNVLLGSKPVNITSSGSSGGSSSITYESIAVNETKSVSITTANQIKYFRFVPSSSGSYTFYSIGSVDTYGILYNSSLTQLKSDDDGGGSRQFKVTYTLTAGTTYYFGAKMYSSGTGSYSVKLISGSSTTKNLSNCQCSLSQTSYTYDGSAKTPTVTVRDGSATLTQGTHYTVSYRNNVSVGTATVTVTGKGNYSGTVTLTFVITQRTYSVDHTKLTFSFGNNYRDMAYNPGSSAVREIPYYNYSKIFGDNQRCRNIFNAKRGPWGGCCFGFTAMSSMLFADGSGVKPYDFGKNTIWNLSTMDWSTRWGGNVRDWIDAMQVSQYSGLIPSKRQNNIVNNSNDRSKLNAIRDAARNVQYTGKPINLCIWGKVGDKNAGHSIVAYGTRKIDSTHEKILCYDCNFINRERTVDLTTDTNGNVLRWYYHEGDKNNWGTGYGNDSISYVSYEDQLRAFNGYEKNNTYCCSMMNVSSNSFTVYDADDNKIATVTDGMLQSETEDVYQILPMGVTEENEVIETQNVMLQMPVGYYKVVNDYDEKFTVSVTDTDRSTTVTTTGDTVEFMVSDDAKVNEAYVYTDPGDTYDILVASSDPDELGEMQVKGTSAGSIVSTSMDCGSIFLDNCVGATITVNGIPIEKCGFAIDADDNDALSFSLPDNGIVGDINFDGKINILDVTLVQRFVGELETFTERQIAAADVDGDGEVTISDATYMQEYLAEYDRKFVDYMW